MKRDGILLGLAAALLLVAAVRASAQERAVNVYSIGVGDILRVSVWQEPSLDREVEVGIDSTIVLPLVGPIRAAGYTPAQLSRILTERYSLYKRDISRSSPISAGSLLSARLPAFVLDRRYVLLSMLLLDFFA